MIPEPGCTRRYYPYRNGEAAVVEIAFGNQWNSFLADIMPQVLADEIQVHEASFYKSLDTMTAEDLYECIPVVVPKCNPIPGCQIPGLGKFPILEYKAAGKPVFNDTNWWLLARAVAKKDMASLRSIFDKSERFLGMPRAAA